MKSVDNTNQNYVEVPSGGSTKKTPIAIGIVVLVLGVLYAIIRPMLKTQATTENTAAAKTKADDSPKEEVDTGTTKKTEPVQEPSVNTGGGAPRR